jgi:hypothetical protein
MNYNSKYNIVFSTLKSIYFKVNCLVFRVFFGLTAADVNEPWNCGLRYYFNTEFRFYQLGYSAIFLTIIINTWHTFYNGVNQSFKEMDVVVY